MNSKQDNLTTNFVRLGECVHPALVDELFEEMLRQLDQRQRLTCTLSPNASLLLQAEEELVAEIATPRAKAILRLMCARLAVRGSAWTGRELSPYGDSFTFAVPGGELRCKVHFQNTPVMQQFELQVEPQAVDAAPRHSENGSGVSAAHHGES